MKLFQTLALVALASYIPAKAAATSVFAHVIFGNVCSYTQAQWKSDIQLAADAAIDAFALNMGAPLSDCFTTQLEYAFAAANALDIGFTLFFSFDYVGGSEVWNAVDIIDLLNQYGSNSAHFKYGENNYPFVSTFEGVDNIDDWNTIRSSVDQGGIYFVPDWTSLTPSGIEAHLDVIDGAFSWDMWPTGPYNSNTTSDLTWVSALSPSSKSYMMGVSPWFFTDLPGYGKAWVWRGDDTWHLRWLETLAVQPEFVEIVTWNDYGESHYIGPIVDAGIPQIEDANATWYVEGMPHDSWRDLLPYYVGMYKGEPIQDNDLLQYWYRLTPVDAGSDGNVTGDNCPSEYNTGAYQTCYPVDQILSDSIFVTALLESAANVTVTVGNNTGTVFAGVAGINHWSVPFGGLTGEPTFQIVRGGEVVVTGTGVAIEAAPKDGAQSNFNAWVGSASSSNKPYVDA